MLNKAQDISVDKQVRSKWFSLQQLFLSSRPLSSCKYSCKAWLQFSIFTVLTNSFWNHRLCTVRAQLALVIAKGLCGKMKHWVNKWLLVKNLSLSLALVQTFSLQCVSIRITCLPQEAILTVKLSSEAQNMAMIYIHPCMCVCVYKHPLYIRVCWWKEPEEFWRSFPELLSVIQWEPRYKIYIFLAALHVFNICIYLIFPRQTEGNTMHYTYRDIYIFHISCNTSLFLSGNTITY